MAIFNKTSPKSVRFFRVKICGVFDMHDSNMFTYYENKYRYEGS